MAWWNLECADKPGGKQDKNIKNKLQNLSIHTNIAVHMLSCTKFSQAELIAIEAAYGGGRLERVFIISCLPHRYLSVGLPKKTHRSSGVWSHQTAAL